MNHTDVSRLQALQGQTVIAIKAPEETKLEIPAPTEVGQQDSAELSCLCPAPSCILHLMSEETRILINDKMQIRVCFVFLFK